ncbi:hypothetical protein [Candidatus Enterococcus mansonii]|uniref:DUF4829 domain-containing protein n=1 Tax=Candidatus Enterococcus mansonii TaxID=1834181 RepID=A0A242CIG2_9ENTE|nr:hypothetical protein [Enterococcus sp. 4G2_DIV0659]OTO10016.1 hypothetical protein A5880_000699 [Enterococcus sp. 4G2_DIV0659]
MKKVTRNLILLNVLVWAVGACVYFVTIKREQSFLKNNEQLIKEMVSFQTYDEYKEKESYLATKMTKTVLDQVCPIVQVSGEVPKITIDNMKTTYSNFQKNKIEIAVSFNRSVAKSPKRLIELKAVYTKNKDKWLMSHYNYI